MAYINFSYANLKLDVIYFLSLLYLLFLFFYVWNYYKIVGTFSFEKIYMYIFFSLIDSSTFLFLNKTSISKKF